MCGCYAGKDAPGAVTESPAYQGSQWEPSDQQPTEKPEGQDEQPLQTLAEEPQAEEAAAAAAQHDSAHPAHSTLDTAFNTTDYSEPAPQISQLPQQPEPTQPKRTQAEGSQHQQPSQGLVGRLAIKPQTHSCMSARDCCALSSWCQNRVVNSRPQALSALVSLHELALIYLLAWL